MQLLNVQWFNTYWNLNIKGVMRKQRDIGAFCGCLGDYQCVASVCGCVCVCVGVCGCIAGGFGHQQALLIFNVDDTDLFWETFPETTSNLNLALKL